MGLYKGNSNKEIPRLLLDPVPKFNLCPGPAGQASLMYVAGSQEEKKRKKIK